MRRLLGALISAGPMAFAAVALAAMGASTPVTFSPGRVHAGEKITVAVAKAWSSAEVRLAARRSQDGKGIGSISGSSRGLTGQVRVPTSTAPGRYYVRVCAKRRCVVSARRLVVLRHRRISTTGGGGSGGSGGGGGNGGGTGTGGRTGGTGGPDNVQYELRVETNMPLHWTPTPEPPPVSEPHGTGSADYALNGKVRLDGDPTSDGANGSGPLTWANFAYTDKNVKELCQDGNYENTNYSAVGSTPGTLTVEDLKITSPNGTSHDPGVTLKMNVSALPGERVHIAWSQGNTACPSYQTTVVQHDWGLQYLPQGAYPQSGVSGFESSNETSTGPEYTVTHWKRASGPAGGNATLVAVKSFSYGIKDYKGGNGNPGGTGTARVKLEIVTVPQRAGGTG